MGVAAAAAAGLGLANFALNPVLAEDGGIRAGYKKMTNIPVPVTVTTLRFRADRHGRIEDPGRKPEPKPAKEEPAVEPTPPEPAAGVVTKAFFKTFHIWTMIRSGVLVSLYLNEMGETWLTP